MSARLLLFFLTSGLATGSPHLTGGCDEDDCNIGISVGVGAARTCAVVGGVTCTFTSWATFGLSCAAALGCGVASAVADAGQSLCALCGEDHSVRNIRMFEYFPPQIFVRIIFVLKFHIRHTMEKTNHLPAEDSLLSSSAS